MLRSNFWLTIHVLTEVSSYAAFGLAWALGLIAMVYYLTATYRRSPRFAELALPLVPGLPLLAVGAAGVAASYGAFGAAVDDRRPALLCLRGHGRRGRDGLAGARCWRSAARSSTACFTGEPFQHERRGILQASERRPR